MFHDPQSLSPDPLFRTHRARSVDGGWFRDIFPWALIRSSCSSLAIRNWSKKLNLYDDPGPISLRADASGRCDMVIDFGTELEAQLQLVIQAAPCRIYVSFGESIPEAETWGIPTTNPIQTVEWSITLKGTRQCTFDQRGFRFVRLQVHHLSGPLVIRRLAASASFAFEKRQGDFLCDDPRYQRVWQTSVYTARLCSRPDTYWDGIKRDRVGWFGDARIIQETTDAVFHDPRPALSMFHRLPVDKWVTGIPGFSLDAIAMFRQMILAYGIRRGACLEPWKRIKAMLAWAERTQLNVDGFIVRDPKANYFGEIAFIDWSRMPIGGKFEELSWLQCKLCEGYRSAAEIAGWLGDYGALKTYYAKAERLARNIMKTFWDPRRGMIHTLNQTSREWWRLMVLPLGGDNEFRKTYFQKKPIGPSGPSRHSMTLAQWAGLLNNASAHRLALKVFNSVSLPPLVTPYFLYYEQCARAECGESRGALESMRDFVGRQIEENDSTTVWEWYQPHVQSIHKYCLGDWPKSLCHGWGSGLVPMTTRYLLGIRPIQPGYAMIRLTTPAPLAMSYELTVPTPQGVIKAWRAGATEPLVLSVPRSIRIDGALPAQTIIRRSR